MMEHFNMQSMDKVAANVAKIRELFPNCVTERINNKGKLEHAIDFDMLKQELSDHVVDGLQERYQFTWPDKRKAILAANAPINKTLRPCREESVDFDNTENLYIEGDNLEVLKLLQETYLGKVKMIYIDPPYNTGNDFIYRDEFKQNASEYKDNSGQYDEEGNQMVTNTESNGRFHTDWLNMIYPRLKLAKDLLSDDGVIFISIGDDEESNLIKCCNEIFGESNFIASICHKHRASVSNDRIISENHNHLLFYCKNIVSVFRNHKLIGEDPVLEGFNLEDEKGKYKLTPVDGPGGAKKGNPHYNFLGVTGYWRYSKETMQKKYDEGLIVRTTNGLQQKYYLSQASKSRKTVTTWWDDDFLTSSATKMLINLMGDKTFYNPKNINLIIRCLKMIVKFDKDSLIIDFFSGSATTAHAVMQLNAEDGGKRKFIMVQLPEVCAENTEAYKAGYKNICEIGKERIRRAGKKIKEENPLTTQDLDIGFRVLKCDSSNMEDVYFTPKEYMDKQQSLFIDNIKKDRNDEDLLFDAMLKLDTPLSSKIEKITIAGKTVYNVAQGHLMACFDKNVTDEVITAVAKEMPSYFVMRDSSQADDSVAINFEQIFNTYSPQTVRRVL